MNYLLIPRLRIHNANALASSYTIGVPAMTAWLGAVHALERKIREDDRFRDVRLPGVGLAVHHCHVHMYRGPKDYQYSLIGTGNPLTKEGKRPSFIEEPRVDLTVSLLAQLRGVDGDNKEDFLDAAEGYLKTMKIASGDVVDMKSPKILTAEEGNEKEERRILMKLMPGYVLLERTKLLAQEMDKEGDSLESLLSLLAIHHTAEKASDGTVTWQNSRKMPGWLVPISVGFKGITPLGRVEKQRDPGKPHAFAENVVTLGEYVMPYRLGSIKEMMWQYVYRPEDQLYLCVNEE